MFKLDRILLIAGIVFIGIFAYSKARAFLYQERLQETFDQMILQDTPGPESPDYSSHKLGEGDLVGRLKIPRLNLSVMVLEGVQTGTLELGAGHIPGTAFPGMSGNTGIAAHRDTFFRPLSKIELNDKIEFDTPEKSTEYRVVSTEIVSPEDTRVLRPRGADSLTLVTCYPFYYVGPAPKRFIVTAEKEDQSVSQVR